MSVHVFVDETERGPYLVAAVVVAATDLEPARRVLRGLCKPGQRRLHMVKERDRRRREILAALCRAGLRTRLYQCSAPPVVARPRCLTALVGDLVDAGADRLVLERLETQQHSDRRTIRAALAGVDAVLPYVHLRAYEEPLLWAPDALAWAYSAGGDWRRRVDPLVDKAVLLDP